MSVCYTLSCYVSLQGVASLVCVLHIELLFVTTRGNLPLQDLNCLTEQYLIPLQSATFLTSGEIQQLFGNIQEIVTFQRQFLISLEEAIQLEEDFFQTEDPKVFRVGLGQPHFGEFMTHSC